MSVPAGLADRLRTIRLVIFDFDGVFTDNAVYVFEDGREAVRCTRADGIGLDRLRSLGIELAVVSTETNPVVQARARKLKLRCVSSCDDKAVAVVALADDLGIPLECAAFVGNDVNDVPALRLVGFPVVVADAHEDVLALSPYRLTRPGGHGAVREFCDMIGRARSAPATDRETEAA